MIVHATKPAVHCHTQPAVIFDLAVEAANRAGMISIGMAGGEAPARDLGAARLVVNTLAEITPAVIRGLVGPLGPF